MSIQIERELSHHFGETKVKVVTDESNSLSYGGDGVQTRISFTMSDNVAPVEIFPTPDGFVLKITGTWEKEAVFQSIHELSAICRRIDRYLEPTKV